MANSRLNITLAPDQRLTLQRYAEVYGISMSKIAVLALMAFFTDHPLSLPAPTYQLADSPDFDSVAELLAFLEAQRHADL